MSSLGLGSGAEGTLAKRMGKSGWEFVAQLTILYQA